MDGPLPIRDSDGVTRLVERRGPVDEHDHHGKLAEDTLIEALVARRAPGAAGAISLDTLVTVLVDRHLARLAEDGRSPATMAPTRSRRATWPNFRDELGVPELTTHSFRKTVATLVDDAGFSARIGADHLGHAKVSMTQDRYMSRGRMHPAVAQLLDHTINDE